MKSTQAKTLNRVPQGPASSSPFQTQNDWSPRRMISSKQHSGNCFRNRSREGLEEYVGIKGDARDPLPNHVGGCFDDKEAKRAGEGLLRNCAVLTCWAGSPSDPIQELSGLFLFAGMAV